MEELFFRRKRIRFDFGVSGLVSAFCPEIHAWKWIDEYEMWGRQLFVHWNTFGIISGQIREDFCVGIANEIEYVNVAKEREQPLTWKYLFSAVEQNCKVLCESKNLCLHWRFNHVRAKIVEKSYSNWNFEWSFNVSKEKIRYVRL